MQAHWNLKDTKKHSEKIFILFSSGENCEANISSSQELISTP